MKHLAGYLPYGLQVIGKTHKEMWTLEGLNISETCELGGSSYRSDINEILPILRPLSDLTKEIEHNGEKFVPCEEYSYLRFKEISNYKGGSNTLKFIQAREQDILLELHFDIHGLIEKGLAIDINTLKQHGSRTKRRNLRRD